MKMRIVILFFIFNCFYNEVFAAIENKIILKVENEIITNFEVKNKILSTLILSNQEINQQNIDNFKKQALEFLIQYKLKKIELSKFNLKNDSSQINNYLNSISGNNINKLKDTFKRNNIDFKLFVDEVETLAINRACQLFGANFANVQPHSGAQANGAVYLALLKPGDTILGMSLNSGGHLTHGAKVAQSGKWLNAFHYEVDKVTGLIDYDQVKELALKNKPKLLIAGGSAYS